MKNKPLVLILLGPPGAGKGTQASLLSHKLNIPHISTGDIFRDNIKKQTLLGKQVQNIIESGGFVSDDIVISIVQDRVSAEDCKKGYILDGYPRTEYQALALERFLNNHARLKVINYSIEDKVIVERLSGRLTCSNCGHPFHKQSNPPKKEGLCDHCSSPLVQRKDDEQATVMERLSIYHKQTAPLIHFYDHHRLLFTVLCKGSIDDILAYTLTLLNN